MSKEEGFDITVSSSKDSSVIFKAGLSDDEVLGQVEAIVEEHPDLQPYKELLERGAILANDGGSVLEEHKSKYSEEEIALVEYEERHSIKSLSPSLILVALVASFAAVNFGHDESAVGGAQLLYVKEFNITNANVQGTVNAAPYLAAGTIGTILALILDKFMGRKLIVFISCFFGVGGSLWQAFSQSLGSLLAARLFLGVGMGLNSAVVPMLIAESSPSKRRGTFLMLWQTFVAFGVMLGSILNRAFVDLEESKAWRLMIGASFVAPLITGALILFVPESPRYLLTVNKDADALKSLIRLRPSKIAAARDFYVLYLSLKKTNEIEKIPLVDQVKLFFIDKRIRFAFLIAIQHIFMQQYCGVNILVGYTTTILVSAGVDSKTAIAGSIGIGGGCFLATFFSSLLIDRKGRRKMLLYTFPILAACLFWLGGSLKIADDKSRLGSGLTSMYVFVIAFGLGIGPVSWTLNAEVYPLHVRHLGVTFGMGTNWLLDFVLSMSWPKMAQSMTASGGLYFYGAWNIYAFFFALIFLPETKQLSLEELDTVFAEGTLHFAKSNISHLTGREKEL